VGCASFRDKRNDMGVSSNAESLPMSPGLSRLEPRTECCQRPVLEHFLFVVSNFISCVASNSNSHFEGHMGQDSWPVILPPGRQSSETLPQMNLPQLGTSFYGKVLVFYSTGKPSKSS